MRFGLYIYYLIVTEAGDVLGVARQQVDRVEAKRKAEREAEHEVHAGGCAREGSAPEDSARKGARFPAPVAWPAGRPAWMLSDISGRTPGAAGGSG